MAKKKNSLSPVMLVTGGCLLFGSGWLVHFAIAEKAHARIMIHPEDGLVLETTPVSCLPYTVE